MRFPETSTLAPSPTSRGRLLPFVARPSLPRIGLRDLLRNSWILVGIAGLIATGIVVVDVATIRFPAFALPDPAPPAQSTALLDVNGKQIAVIHGDQHRVVVPMQQIPEHFRMAVLAAEDDGFYHHHGVDGPSVVRAMLANVSKGGVVQGGSTITQQYVRNAFPSVGRDRTLGRKVREAFLAMRVESQLSKDEILQRYLNLVYFGRGAYGVEAAARRFFNKHAPQLTLSESAFLAGVIRGPEMYAQDMAAATARRDFVLDRMAELGFAPAAQVELAKMTPPTLTRGAEDKADAAYFVEFVRRQLKEPVEEGGFGLTDQQILAGGLSIRTTLDMNMQKAAERAVARVLDRPGDPEVGMVAMTTDGQIRAMVGGRDFTSLERARGFNFAAQKGSGIAGRQAGSAFKPFTLAAWLAHGGSAMQRFSAPSRIAVPACGNGREPWKPANYDNEGFGSLTVLDATAKSVNTVYAQMVAQVGPERVVDMAREAGIESHLDPVCSIALGTFGVTPLEMARAYSTFAQRGLRPQVVAVRSITGPDGKVIATRGTRPERTIDPDVADRVNRILEHVVDSGTGRPAGIDRPAAGKTGTTDSHRDVWYAGYTPAPGLTAAIWIGYPPDKSGRIRPMLSLHGRPATGGGFAGRIWKYFMESALAGMPVAQFADVGWGPARPVRLRSVSANSVLVEEDPSQVRRPPPANAPPQEPSQPQTRPTRKPQAEPQPSATPTPQSSSSPPPSKHKKNQQSPSPEPRPSESPTPAATSGSG